MARVTIEKALDKVNSRFELVVLASYRANVIACGGRTSVKSNDKHAVLAIREIEEGLVSIDTLRDAAIKKYRFEDSSPMTSNAFLSTDFSFGDATMLDSKSDTEDSGFSGLVNKNGSLSLDTSLFGSEDE